MEPTNKIPQRDQIPLEDTWALEDLFPSDDAWEQEIASVAAMGETLGGY